MSVRWTRPAERTNAHRKDRGIGGGSRDTFVVSPERFAAEQPVFVQIISERSNQMRLRTIAAAFVVAAPLFALAKSPGRSLLGKGVSLRVFLVRVFLALSRLLRWRWSPPGWLRGRGLAPWLRIPRGRHWPGGCRSGGCRPGGQASVAPQRLTLGCPRASVSTMGARGTRSLDVRCRSRSRSRRSGLPAGIGIDAGPVMLTGLCKASGIVRELELRSERLAAR